MGLFRWRQVVAVVFGGLYILEIIAAKSQLRVYSASTHLNILLRLPDPGALAGPALGQGR